MSLESPETDDENLNAESRKVAVEIAVDELGLEKTEKRIKERTEANSDLQLGLLSHARRYAAGEVTA